MTGQFQAEQHKRVGQACRSRPVRTFFTSFTSSSVSLAAGENFLYVFQGRTSGAPAWPAQAKARRMRKTCTEGVNEPGSTVRSSQGVVGTLAAGGGAAWPGSSCAGAHRRGPLPATPTPRTRPQPHPAVTHHGSCVPRASRAGSSRRLHQSPDERSQHRAGTPHILRAGHSSVKGTRRSFLRSVRDFARKEWPLRGSPVDGLT